MVTRAASPYDSSPGAKASFSNIALAQCSALLLWGGSWLEPHDGPCVGDPGGGDMVRNMRGKVTEISWKVAAWGAGYPSSRGWLLA